MKLWKCSVCGYVHEGEDSPQNCPKCGAPKEKLIELSAEDTKKVYASDRTNDIHMEIIALSSKIIELCKEGIELDLDPPCVAGFKKAKDDLWLTKQIAKAELEGHMNKGKW